MSVHPSAQVPSGPTEPYRRSAPAGNRKAAFTLVLLAPLIAELALGSTPMRMAWLLPLFVPIYGAGILLVRELVHRAGRGWLSIVVLGVAYEIIEDGIGLQALTSPNIYGAAEWGARVLGINAPYWEAQAIYHVVFSAVIPIVITDLIFPSHRHTPYLKRGGLVLTAVVAVAGVGLLRISVPPTVDPGYMAPVWATVSSIVLMIILGVVALRLLPPRKDVPGLPGRVPTRWQLIIIGLVGTIVILGLVFPVAGAKQPGFTQGLWVLVPMGIALALAILTIVQIRWWTRRAGWTDLHVLALAGGALVGHTTFGMAVFARTTFDRVGLAVMVMLTVVGLALLVRRILAREG